MRATNLTTNGYRILQMSKKQQPKTSEYKGHTLLVLNPDAKFPFQFGKAKAQQIVENWPVIAHFAETGELLQEEEVK